MCPAHGIAVMSWLILLPVPTDDILGHPNKRKGRPGMLAVPGEEDGLDASGSPMRPGGIMSNRGRPGMAQVCFEVVMQASRGWLAM
jgi:hypothetical protein